MQSIKIISQPQEITRVYANVQTQIEETDEDESQIISFSPQKINKPKSSNLKPLSLILIAILIYCLFAIWVLSWFWARHQKAEEVIQINQKMSIDTKEAKILNRDVFLQFMQKHNVKKQPQDLFFAKYLLDEGQIRIEKFEQKHKYQIEYLNRKYKGFSTEKLPETSMCVVATGRNNMANQRQKRFLDSVYDLNYNNLFLVYVDDNSDDNTATFTKEYLTNNDRLKDKSKVIVRDRRFFALANKILAFDEYCRQNDIIIDVDSDDRFLGREALNIINFLYSKNQQLWFIYTNHLLREKENYNIGQNRKLNAEQFLQYRVSDYWVTSHMKTYRKKLFSKIDKTEWLRQDGDYYHWASDRYLIYSLTQLAGYEHTHFEDIVTYLYDYEAASDVRNFEIIKPDKLRSKLLTPYRALKSLQDTAKKVEDYKPPALLKQYFQRAKLKYESLVKKNQIPL